MKHLLLFVLFSSFYLGLQSQARLSENATISLITCSPGDDLYNTFGHSAIRVYDEANNFNWVFNYGTFSFGGDGIADQLDFGITFARGKLLYHLSINGFDRFVKSYTYQERSVYEQVLSLTQEQKQAIFNKLYINQKPENKYYKYDFFYDNCSSRIRDIIEDALGKDLQIAASGIDIKADGGFTFMDMIEPYIKSSYWTKWGIYILLGLPANEDASEYEQMFLPDYLMHHFGKAKLRKDGELIPFILETKTIYQAPPKAKKAGFYTSPFFWFGLLLGVVGFISYRNYQFEKHLFWIDYIVFTFTGLIGILLLFMWFGTDHITTKVNLNLLWAIPFNLIALFFLKKPKVLMYLQVVLITTLLLLVAWFILPQKMHISFLPITGIMMVRYLKLISWHRNGPSTASPSNA